MPAIALQPLSHYSLKSDAEQLLKKVMAEALRARRAIEQIVPCAGPVSGGAWKNHGRYVSQFVKAVAEFFTAGLITEAERDALVAGAAASKCGS